MSEKIFSDQGKSQGYTQLLIEVRSIIEKGRVKAYQAIDTIRVQTYWQIGERVAREILRYRDRADYGKTVIQLLAKDIGFSRRLFFEIVEFYRVYPIVHAVRAQLSWTHFGVLIRIKDQKQREFYEVQTINNQWSYRELEKRIKEKEYENFRDIDQIDLTISGKKLLSPLEIIKKTYVLEFLGIPEKHSEEELETALIRHIRETLLILGKGFAFIGHQKNILISGRYYRIDLLFYHVEIPCYVVVELKAERFKHEHIGQMNFYLNYFREHKKQPWERDPIGLIICKEHDEREVHYALGGLEEKIFVAEYKTRLPSEQELKKRLEKL